MPLSSSHWLMNIKSIRIMELKENLNVFKEASQWLFIDFFFNFNLRRGVGIIWSTWKLSLEKAEGTRKKHKWGRMRNVITVEIKTKHYFGTKHLNNLAIFHKSFFLFFCDASKKNETYGLTAIVCLIFSFATPYHKR